MAAICDIARFGADTAAEAMLHWLDCVLHAAVETIPDRSHSLDSLDFSFLIPSFGHECVNSTTYVRLPRRILSLKSTRKMSSAARSATSSHPDPDRNLPAFLVA
ncbi:hypothetical protein LA080_000488 [Diaporthe eres]|nr:hypothetical protein LA080_000488 [Diaporthe eres]